MAKRRNPKREALRDQGTLNPHPERVLDEVFLEHDFFDPKDLLQVKYEMLRKRRVEGETATRAAEVFGFSRPSFYQAQEAFEREGISGLIPHRRGPKEAHKLSGPVVAFIREALKADESLRMAAAWSGWWMNNLISTYIPGALNAPWRGIKKKVFDAIGFAWRSQPRTRQGVGSALRRTSRAGLAACRSHGIPPGLGAVRA